VSGTGKPGPDRDHGNSLRCRYFADCNTVPAQAGGSGVGADSSVTQNAYLVPRLTGNFVTIVGPTRVKLAAAATIHLVAADTFSAARLGFLAPSAHVAFVKENWNGDRYDYGRTV